MYEKTVLTNSLIASCLCLLGELTFSGLLNFGKFDNTSYDFIEIPVFMIMGCLGGLLGALFNHLNFKLTVFRIRYLFVPCLMCCV